MHTRFSLLYDEAKHKSRCVMEVYEKFKGRKLPLDLPAMPCAVDSEAKLARWVSFHLKVISYNCSVSVFSKLITHLRKSLVGFSCLTVHTSYIFFYDFAKKKAMRLPIEESIHTPTKK
ncbi:hypothetical protein AVEN_173161-1 [Araneus ventricosus]|uniref:Uncharacterized protein n=1 Tax=Araneus ventricosus TaxID=182803 RepID=A0A4Y2VDV0_ARAVE|nr:hypothetical protein AVEN_173161-1 [Araneus ventricosus]